MSTLKQEQLATLIEVHYSALPFASKEQVYWAKQFPKDLLGWAALVGIRSEPDELIENDIISTLVGEFPYLNENSVVDALKMNLRGGLSERYEPYNQINRVFLTKVLCDYEKKVKQANKRAMEIRDRDKVVELTPEQKEQKFRDAVIESFNIFKQFGEESILTFNMYDLLDRLGKINFSKAEKDQFMYRAKARLQDINDNPNNRIAITPLDFSNGDTKLKLVNIAKVMAVAEYFRTIETLEL